MLKALQWISRIKSIYLGLIGCMIFYHLYQAELPRGFGMFFFVAVIGSFMVEIFIQRDAKTIGSNVLDILAVPVSLIAANLIESHDMVFVLIQFAIIDVFVSFSSVLVYGVVVNFKSLWKDPGSFDPRLMFGIIFIVLIFGAIAVVSFEGILEWIANDSLLIAISMGIGVLYGVIRKTSLLYDSEKLRFGDKDRFVEFVIHLVALFVIIVIYAKFIA